MNFIRPWLGCLSTLVTSCFLMGCDNFDRPKLSLPAQAVTLSSANPEHVSRFAVESDDGKFELDVKFLTTTNAATRLQVQAIGNNTSSVSYRWNTVNSNSANELERSLGVAVDCPRVFPCVAEFEVTIAADNVGADAVTGSLFVTASMDRVNDGYYLSIAPR